MSKGWTKFTEQQVNDIRRLYKQGASTEVIARYVGQPKKRTYQKIYMMVRSGLMDAKQLDLTPMPEAVTKSASRSLTKTLDPVGSAVGVICGLNGQMSAEEKLRIISILVGRDSSGEDREVTQRTEFLRSDRAEGYST